MEHLSVSSHYDVPEFYEPEVVNVMERFLQPGDCAVDAGASVGFFTCLASKLVGAEGLVLAFEPNLESFEHLRRNVEMRKLANVRAFRKALWSVNLPEIQLWSVDEIGYTSVCHYANATNTECVEAFALDDFLPEGLVPRFLKIDCELAEFEVLRGAQRILREGIDCVVLEFNYHLMVQNGMSDHLIRDFMSDLGYDMFLINIGNQEEGGFRSPIKVDRAAEIQMRGNHIHINVMFSREEKVRPLWMT